jgi:hypothetical protein
MIIKISDRDAHLLERLLFDLWWVWNRDKESVHLTDGERQMVPYLINLIQREQQKKRRCSYADNSEG